MTNKDLFKWISNEIKYADEIKINVYAWNYEADAEGNIVDIEVELITDGNTDKQYVKAIEVVDNKNLTDKEEKKILKEVAKLGKAIAERYTIDMDVNDKYIMGL